MSTFARSLSFVFVTGSVLLVLAVQAGATMITFDTPSGSTIGGSAVNAQAVLTTSANQITVTLRNLEVNPTSVAQNISDFLFQLDGTFSGGTLAGSSGKERTVAGGGSFTDGSVVSTGWDLTSSGSNFTLDVLGAPAGASHTIIRRAQRFQRLQPANGLSRATGPTTRFWLGM